MRVSLSLSACLLRGEEKAKRLNSESSVKWNKRVNPKIDGSLMFIFVNRTFASRFLFISMFGRFSTPLHFFSFSLLLPQHFFPSFLFFIESSLAIKFVAVKSPRLGILFISANVSNTRFPVERIIIIAFAVILEILLSKRVSEQSILLKEYNIYLLRPDLTNQFRTRDSTGC